MTAVDDQEALEATLRALYAAISFPEGGEPHWTEMNDVFHSSARLTRVTPEGTDYFTLESFQAMAAEMLDRGMYTSFYEVELTRSAQIFGSFAHVLSAYGTKRSKDALSYLSRGVNSIQLLRSGSTWQIFSLLWDEESTVSPLDLCDLFQARSV